MVDYDELVKRDQNKARTMGELFSITSLNVPDDIAIPHMQGNSVAYEFNKKYALLMFPLFGETNLRLCKDNKEFAYKSGFDFVQKAADLVGILSDRIGIEAKLASFSNIIDWGNPTDEDDILTKLVMSGMIDASKKYKCGCVAGESAVLTGRVITPFTISGAATAVVEIDEIIYNSPYKIGTKLYAHSSTKPFGFTLMSHDEKLVLWKCDGTGTKPATNFERLGNGSTDTNADLSAMVWDDVGKSRINKALCQLNSVEYGFIITPEKKMTDIEKRFNKGTEHTENEINRYLELASNDRMGIRNNAIHGPLEFLNSAGIGIINNFMDATGRINGYGNEYINPNSTAVALIEKEDFYNPPKPKEGCSVIQLKGLLSSVRSNGHTKLMENMIDVYGEDYHLEAHDLTVELGQGSTIFYPFFQEALREGAVFVGHYSGGAYRDKFGKEFAREGLGGDFIVNFEPHPAHQLSKKQTGWTAQEMAGKYAYCGEGYILVENGSEEKFRDMASKYDLLTEVIGTLQKMDKPRVSITFNKAGDKPETAVFEYD